MRIAVIGQAAFGEKVLEALLKAGEQVVAVSAPATPPGGRPDPLGELARAKGLPVFPTRDFKKDDVYYEYKGLKPDLNVMAYVTDILAERVLYTPFQGTIQYHPSLLPRHRGASAMNWAIMQGEKETGLTIFWPERGIDTGPILLQKEVDITPDDTLGSLYFGKLFPMGVDAILESVALVKAGKAPKIRQDHSKATYEPVCGDEHAAIRWDRPAQEVYDFIRGCNPQPGAYTAHQGAQLRIYDCSLLNGETTGAPGEVLAVTPEGFTVALKGGSLSVKRVQPAKSAKVKAGEYAANVGLQPGQRLGV